MARTKTPNIPNLLLALAVLGVVVVFLNSGVLLRGGSLQAVFVRLASMAVSIAAVVFCIGVVIWCFRSSASRTSRADALRELRAAEHLTPPQIGTALDMLDWYQLEQLAAALFEAKGTLVQRRGGAVADGGIDLVIDSDGVRAAVQCKHWSKAQCGVAVVRELSGAMSHEKFDRGFLICREATLDALDVAASSGITVIRRQGLVERITEQIQNNSLALRRALLHPEKRCPKCGAQMVLRTSSKGASAGRKFWGCSQFPRCRQKMSL